MSITDQIEQKLIERDKVEKQLLPLFLTFQEASRRAVQAANETPRQPASSPAPALAPADSSTKSKSKSPVGDSNPSSDDLVQRLTESRAQLQKKLDTMESQLIQAQERVREVAEEQFLKTNATQALCDEILSLSLQLNLSEARRKKLQEELGR